MVFRNSVLRNSVKARYVLPRVALLAVVLLLCVACQPKRGQSPGDAGQPPPPSYFYHTVKYPGETLSIIAGWYLGSANEWRTIVDHNPGLDPRRIRIGQEIAIPAAMMMRQDPLPRSAVRVSEPRPAPKEREQGQDGSMDAGYSGSEHTDGAESNAPAQEPESSGTVTEDSIDLGLGTDNSGAETFPSDEARMPAESGGAEMEPPSGDSGGLAESGASSPGANEDSQPASGGQAETGNTGSQQKPEMRIKTRDELLRELLEE